MKRLICIALLASGCATTANYVYSFDLTDPGARNVSKPGERDVLEDADIKSEILVDPTSFRAILLDITNKTEAPLDIGWGQISLIGPDKTAIPIHPDQRLGPIEPGTRAVARLIDFALPAQGPAAAGYDQSTFELIVPMVVRGVPREVRYHLIARVQKL